MSAIYGNMLTFGSGGGGSSGVYAAIKVAYPPGSTCTATNGTTTLIASDTSGMYIFGIPEPTSTPETWTISCTDGNSSLSETISITEYGQFETVYLFDVGSSLNNTSWSVISAISKVGIGDTYWDIGDCKAVVINGTIGTLAIDTTLYVFILDFNHPINKSTADNNIIWGGFKTALTGGVDVALCDASYNSNMSDGTKIFNINHRGESKAPYNTNYGGWKGCDLRYDILGGTSTQPSGYTSTPTTNRKGYDATQATINTPVANTLMAALPSDLRAVLRLWNRYIDYVGNAYNTDANCSTATVDALSLLAEFEIFGSRTYANQYEQNHQKQMAYYSAGNSKKKYKHNATGSACYWWEASANYNTMTSFCYVNTSGGANTRVSRTSYGVAPAFRT